MQSATAMSRRYFGKLAALLPAGAALPVVNEFTLALHAQERIQVGPVLPGAARLSGNENPLGPCPEALEAISRIACQAGWYDPNGEAAEFLDTVAALEGLPRDHVHAFAGSADPLHRALFALTSPQKPLVLAIPGYEIPELSARFVGAKVIRVPLRKDLAHDVKAMVKAAPNAGVFYVCNPNNPTGTITPRADIEWLLTHKPKDSVVILDEAYIQYSLEAPASDLVAKGKDLIVLRTFSKAYGLAGLRAGMALARPDLMSKILPYGAGKMSITAAVAATASMRSPDLIPERRRINAETREDVLNFLEQRRIGYVPGPRANYFLMDTQRPGAEFAKEMAKQNVYVGRTWQTHPNHARVTIGNREAMGKFKEAVKKVMA